MTWVGDLLRAGIDAKGSTIKVNKPMQFNDPIQFSKPPAIPVVADDAARTALGTPQEGWLVVNLDTETHGALEVYADGEWRMVDELSAKSG